MPVPENVSEIAFRSHLRAPYAEVERQIGSGHYCMHMPLRFGKIRSFSAENKSSEHLLELGGFRLSSPGEQVQVRHLTPTKILELELPEAVLRRAFRESGFRWPSGPTRFRPLYRPNSTVACLAKAFDSAASLSQRQRQPYVEGLTRSLLAVLIDLNHFQLPLEGPSYTRPLDDSHFMRCVEFADSVLDQHMSIQQWAAVLHMEVGEFTRAFRRRTKETPYAWFVNRRVELAKQLLMNSTLPLVEIALRTGFCSQSHFSETFRRRVGCSPAKWLESRLTQNIDTRDQA